VRHYRTGLLPRVMTRRHSKRPAVRGRAHVTGRPRLCVRLRVCWTPRPLVSPLLSTPSANAGALEPLFEGFSDTTGLSDFPRPYIMGVSREGSPCGPWYAQGQTQALPIPVHGVSGHARGLRPRRVSTCLAVAADTIWPAVCSEHLSTQKSPDFGAPYPACTSPVNASRPALPLAAHDSGPVWLAHLPCKGLAPSTLCRFSSALSRTPGVSCGGKRGRGSWVGARRVALRYVSSRPPLR
jgi:hypothetical protein